MQRCSCNTVQIRLSQKVHFVGRRMNLCIEKFIIKEAFLKVALLVGIERACSSVVPYQTETTSIMQI